MNNKLDLHIFDFDGTLFKSPEPNPSIWQPSFLGKIQGVPSESGLGWFQETITLDEPYVPLELNRDEWFNINILNSALESTKNPNNITCLLTGRTTLYEKIIDRILNSVELKLKHIGLKPVHPTDGGKKESTFDFKKRFILDLVNKTYADQIQSITIYEDRIKHVTLFNQFLATIPNLTSFQVVHVEEPSRYLDETMEKNLINYLIEKNSNGSQLEFKPDYTCIKLEQKSIDKILSWFQLPKEWNIKTHHVTLNMGYYNPKLWLSQTLSSEQQLLSNLENLKINENNNNNNNNNNNLTSISKLEVTDQEKEELAKEVSKQYPIDKEMKLQVTDIGISSNAIAIKVQGCQSVNQLIHCTVAIHPSASAVDSNKIQNWYNLKQLASSSDNGEINEITLQSHNEEQLKEYNQTIQDQQKQPTTNPSPHAKKKIQILPPTSCTITIQNCFNSPDTLEITGHITEVGKFSIKEANPPPKKAANKNAASGGVDRQVIFQTISKLHKDLNKQEVSGFMAQTMKYISENSITQQTDIETFIQNLKK